ncbi:hypothetical protein T484DRAFT_2128857 [Baffinella frigidus]|nr:hypothetical protein T484DRAFT_2128857 [Cryptophyta sp. CCMP2293]
MIEVPLYSLVLWLVAVVFDNLLKPGFPLRGWRPTGCRGSMAGLRSCEKGENGGVISPHALNHLAATGVFTNTVHLNDSY